MLPKRSSLKPLSDNEPIVPEVHTWRPFRRDDLDAVLLLENYTAHCFFGTFDVEEITELSGHSIVVLNKTNQLIACVCLHNYPNIPAILPEVWPEVVRNLYKANELTYENTLFVHMLLCDCRYNWDFLYLIMRTMFMCMFKLQYVAIVMPPDAEKYLNFSGHMLAKNFVRMLPTLRTRNKSFHDTQKLFVAFRDRILQPLKVRYALAEDNDDVVEILDYTAPQLKVQYGEFYIAEMVLDERSNRKMIVAEHDNKVVGMLCLNCLVSRRKISRIFDLSAFDGMRKPITEHILKSVSDIYTRRLSTGFAEKPSGNVIAIREPSFSTDDTYGESSESNSGCDRDAQSGGLPPSTEEFLKLLRVTYNLITTSNMSFVYSTTTDNESEVELVKSDSYKNHKQEYLQNNPAGANTLKSFDKDLTYEADVFLIELFCTHKDIDERRAFDLIIAAFETFPDLSYCLIALPSETRFFPLLSFFVNLATRTLVMQCPRTKIFLLHRNALFSPLVVSLIHPDDEEPLRQYLTAMFNGENLLNFVFSAARKFHIDAECNVFPIIIRCLDTIIGICVIQTYKFLSRLRVYYHIDTIINSKHHSHYNKVGMIELMSLQPAFMNRLPFIQSEFFRITGFTSLFFKIKYTSPNSESVVNTMLSEMIPVRPRIRMIYHTDMLLKEGISFPQFQQERSKKPYALYHSNINMCAKRKLPVNEKIVLVGCSTTAISFLEELLFRKEFQHVWFTSITMISPNGLAAVVFEDISELAKCFFFKEKYNPEYIRRLGLGVWVNVEHASVVKIDRQQKSVHVSDGRHFPYDRLFLFCGLQFDYPINVKVPEIQPTNVVFLNNIREAELFTFHVKSLPLNSDELSVIVYGDSSFCYSCLDLLLQLQVKPSCITYVRPKAKEKIVGCISPFNDIFVDDLMLKLLQSSGIKVLENFDIVDWILDKDNAVAKINVASDLSILELKCSLFVCFERQIVMRRTIRVLNEAGLVFDGRLVISSNYETNDPSIFAAGPMTKYRRILFAENYRHQYYSSMEVGARLAKQLFEELDPVRPFSARAASHTVPGTVHIFRNPVVQYRPVLDGYRFVHLSIPGLPVPVELKKSSDKYGIDLITTQNCPSDVWGSKDVRYFRCRLNEYNKIVTIVCLTREPVNINLLLAIWGNHESLLHSLRLRYEHNLIPDLYAHFHMPWAYVLYHDMYGFDLNLKNLHVSLHHSNTFLNLNEETREQIISNYYEKLTEHQRENIVARFVTTSYRDLVEKNLMHFLYEHIDDLPMFSLPSNGGNE